MSELLSCPFCGCHPKVEKDRDTGPGVWLRPQPWPAQNMVCRISCCNVRIYKSMTVSNNDETRAADFALELAAGEWNRRPKPPISVRPGGECLNVIINRGDSVRPRSCPKCGLARECPDGVKRDYPSGHW